jgi:hypothetical protein
VRTGFVSVAVLATIAACGGESSAEPLAEGDLDAAAESFEADVEAAQPVLDSVDFG